MQSAYLGEPKGRCPQPPPNSVPSAFVQSVGLMWVFHRCIFGWGEEEEMCRVIFVKIQRLPEEMVNEWRGLTLGNVVPCSETPIPCWLPKPGRGEGLAKAAPV